MKKLLLILLCLPMIGFGQLTYVPDDNFEAYLEANGMGNGVMDDSVFTSKIDSVIYLNLSMIPPGQPTSGSAGLIVDFTGIEAFISLHHLIIDYNFSGSLDLSFAPDLLNFSCDWCGLTSVDVSNNTLLQEMSCALSGITTLDLSNNIHLIALNCSFSDAITSLDLRNGNNHNITNANFSTYNSPNLSCINVNDVIYSTSNWTSYIDSQQYFSVNCIAIAIQEHTTNKELLKATDLLGRETTEKTNGPLFYIYDDGTVEKRIVIE